MTSIKTVPTIVIVSFLIIAIPAALFFLKQPNPGLTPAEKELIEFSNKPMALPPTQSQATFSGLNSPVNAAPKQRQDTRVKNGKPVPVPKKGQPRSLASLPVVSMIYFAGSTRMAIVDDHVVREGSQLDNGVIVKIEETRVLMRKNGKDIWLTTER